MLCSAGVSVQCRLKQLCMHGEGLNFIAVGMNAGVTVSKRVCRVRSRCVIWR